MFIASRCVGSAIRAAETADAYARERDAFGQKIADTAVDLMTAKTLLYRCAAKIDSGIERKLAHARASARVHGDGRAGL